MIKLEEIENVITHDDGSISLVIKGIKRELSNGLITSIIDIQKKLSTGDEKDYKKASDSILKMYKRHGVVYAEVLDRISFITWDILTLDDYFSGINKEPRVTRLTNLSLILEKMNSSRIELVEHKFVHTYDEAMAYFAESLERGEEGVIVKSLDGVWKDGKHAYQIKLKVEFTLDLKIVGFNYGTKGTKNENVISSLNCESSEGKLTARAQGITEDLMDYITDNQDTLLNTIVEVKCNGLSSNQNGGHSVLYPSLMKFRTDKSEANSFEECLEIDRAAKGLM